MKSIVAVLLCLCLAVTLHAAAIEPVVEELQSDANPAATATSEKDLITNEDCHQPKETGRCFALFYRYAYDVEKRECVEFIYGGCGGNSNNFEAKEECEQKCMKKAEEAPAAETTLATEKAEEPEKAEDSEKVAEPEKAEQSESATVIPAENPVTSE